MPFWKKDKEEGSKEARGKEKVNYKARLEHKQYLVGSSFVVQAQESPEPVYDLADCGLKSVPSGVYARCRISRKQALLLQVSSLSQVEGI